jgi:hypothetical protein
MSYYHHLIKSAVVPAYGALTTAWITATSETDTTIISALNTLETDLTTYGLTAKIKALYPMVGGTAAKHKFNFMDARDLDAAFRLTFNGGWTHSSTGATPNGTNAYANTFWVQGDFPSTNNNTSLGFYSGTSTDGNVDMGAFLGTAYLLGSRRSGDFAGYCQSLATYSSIANSNGSGFFVLSRTESSKIAMYKNGTLLSNPSNASTGGLVMSQLQLSAYNSGYFGSKEHRLDIISEGLTPTQAANFYTAVQAFQTTLSRNV